MKIMKTILIDDEAMALEVLQQMLSPYKEIEILGSYTDYKEVIQDLKKIKPELVFLDIEMPEINGLELAEIIMGEVEDVEIVFVTAYSQYAVDAFEINAIDYLLKPIQEKRLAKAIKRIKERKAEKIKYNKTIKTSSQLKVYSFGGFQVIDGKKNSISWRTQKSKELFAYLWIRSRSISSKDLIIDSIFPDKKIDKASALLHTTIYQLRKSLEKLGYSKAIVYLEEGYYLDLNVSSDVEDLRNIIDQKRYSKYDIEEILTIYKGDFLEEGYNWAIELQQTYRYLVFKTIEIFARDEIEDMKYNKVLKASLDKLYEIDPLNDSVVEMMIDFYGKQNEISNLEIFFKNYKKELWEEMGLKPIKHIIDTYNKYI